MKSLPQMKREAHWWLRFGRVLQAMTCLAGAACLWAAIDDWFIGYPFRSAIFTVMAFWNGYNFVRACDYAREWHKLLREIRDIERITKS